MMKSDMGLSLNRRHFNAGVTGLLMATGLTAWAKANGPILVLGDSLSAEYGLKRGTGWVALLEQRHGKEGKQTPVVNASISGDTTSGGLSRLPPLLTQHQPQLVVVELGGNDALRGLPLNITHDNLKAIVKACQTQGAKVLLLGMQMPPNYGPQYAAQFSTIYADVAKAKKAALVPFFLKGVADVPQSEQWFQSDRIHPIEAAHPVLLNNVWPVLVKLIA